MPDGVFIRADDDGLVVFREGPAPTRADIALVDVLACACGGRRAIVADISDSEVIVTILAHLGLPTEAPPLARAQRPAFELS